VAALAALTRIPPAISAEEPSLEVIPAQVAARTLLKGAPIEVEVRLKGGDAQLAAISLSAFSNDGIIAEFASETPQELKNLSPKAEYSWRLKLTRPAGSILTDSILHARAGFDIVPAAGSTPAGSGTAVHRFLYTTATIKPPAAIGEIELSIAEIKGAPEILAHERPGHLFVFITNEYSKPLTVTNVKTLGPTFIEVVNPSATITADKQKPHPKLPMKIDPGRVGYLDYDIEATSEVVPGKQTVVIAADITTEDGTSATIRTAPLDVNVAVLGESDILKFLGIPSLLFLPGLLMLATWRFLWSLRKSSDEIAKYPLQWNTADFWIISIALSLATAWLYPFLRQLSS